MRILTFLVALVPCAVLAAQDAPATPAPEAEASPAAESAPPAEAEQAAPTTTEAAPGDQAAPEAAAPDQGAEAPVEDLPLPPPPPPAAAPYPQWGLFLGAGFPQAASLSVIYRPVPLVRLHAGPSWDYLGFGYHGGVTLTPVRWAVSPTLGFEAGRFASFDVTKVVDDPDPEVAALMKDVTVTYAAALVGVEFGSQRGFAFDLRVGLTWLRVDSKGTGTFTGTGGTVGGGGTTNDTTIRVTNPTLRATAPTVQLGVQYFF